MDLSEEFLHWAAKQRDGLPRNVEGTTLAAAASALAEVGQPFEQVWPYDDGRDELAADYGPPDGAIDVAGDQRLDGSGPVQATSQTIRAWLDAGRAIVLGVRLYGTWFNPAPSGRIAMPPAGAVQLGAHAVFVVGYEDGIGAGGGWVIVRNSWGTDWGDDGYGLLPYAYVDRHVIRAWELGTPLGEARAT